MVAHCLRRGVESCGVKGTLRDNDKIFEVYDGVGPEFCRGIGLGAEARMEVPVNQSAAYTQILNCKLDGLSVNVHKLFTKQIDKIKMAQ